LTTGLASAAVDLLDRREPAVLITVVQAPAGRSLETGQKALLYAGGALSDPLGGGDLEKAIVRDGLRALEQESAGLRIYSPSGDPATKRGRGTIRVYLEPLIPRDRLVLVGAGHVALAVARIAALVGFEITVIDDRSDFASARRFPEAAQIIVADVGETLGALPIDQNTYVVLVTRAHAFDEKALEQVLNTDARYIGMIGSRRRVLVVYRKMMSLGFSGDSLRRVYAPIGLDFGARTAEEIALAIVAEAVKVKRGGRAPSLRLEQWERYLGTEGKPPARVRS